jgi:signal transduction histidine kinase
VESQVELLIVTTPNIGSFSADAKRVRQVLFALLSNAIGFSEPGQTVTLAALRRDTEIVFKVSDHGRGIPPEVLDKVFDRFESQTLNSRHRGVGLGLSIVRAFVELHGGEVHIESAPGEGTVVTCRFPFEAAGIKAELPSQTENKKDEA